MMGRRIIFSLLVVIFLFGFSFNYSKHVAAQEGNSETFPNGLIVSGEFLNFYRSVDDPERLFGLPYTVVFTDPFPPGKKIQYFDRVRMEYDASQPEGQRITLAPLGDYAHSDAQPGQPIPATANMCRSFTNGKSVCYAFLDLYNRYGEKILGLPITNAEYAENGRLVQYFTRARMEWRVEMPSGKRVVLTELGRIDFEKRIGNPLYKTANGQQVIVPEKIDPKLYAFVARPLIANDHKQQVYALLYDQNDQPIQDAQIVIKVILPEGVPPIPNLPSKATNEYGFTSSEFSVENLRPNQEVQVVIEAKIENGPTTTATTWFRVWW
jgi:hypothetical protein